MDAVQGSTSHVNEPSDGSVVDPTNIWAYRSARDFVRDRGEWLRESAGLSWRQLGQAAGFGSPNYIQTWLQGKRNLKPANVAGLAQALQLDTAESERLVLLVQFEQAGSPAEAATWYEELLAHAQRHRRVDRIDLARLNYFSQPWIPVVHAMASLHGFQADSNWIASRIVPPIRPIEARQALDTLTTLGILDIGDDGRVTVREPRLETDDGTQSVLIRAWMRERVAAAVAAIDAWPRERRASSGFIATVPHELVPEVIARAEAFRQALFDWLMDQQRGRRDIEGEVMQVSVQAFPLTEFGNDTDALQGKDDACPDDS